MPEANVLYSVTGVVVVGLIAWVAMVLKSAKEPWVRPAPAELPSEEAPASTEAKDSVDADDTSRQTPVALSEGRAKAAEKADDKKDEEEPKAEEPKAEEPKAEEPKADEEEEKKEDEEKKVV